LSILLRTAKESFVFTFLEKSLLQLKY